MALNNMDKWQTDEEFDALVKEGQHNKLMRYRDHTLIQSLIDTTVRVIPRESVKFTGYFTQSTRAANWAEAICVVDARHFLLESTI